MSRREILDRYLTTFFSQANRSTPEDVLHEFEQTCAPYLPADRAAPILDFGCGMGQILYCLDRRGYTSFSGIDVGQEQIAHCRALVGERAELVDDPIAYLRERPEHWAAVIMRDVIEHLPKPEVVPTLKAIRTALVPGGTLIVETGNMASYTGVYLLHNDFTHEVGFTENSLRQALGVAGYSDVVVRGVETPLGRRHRVMRRLWQSYLRLVYKLERGPAGVPAILAKLLLATARK